MKTYTVDFESFGVEAKTYDEAKEKAMNQAWKDHAWTLDDDLLQDEEQKQNNEWTAVFSSLYIDANTELLAWNKAEEFAKAHDLDIIEMDDGYEY